MCKHVQERSWRDWVEECNFDVSSTELWRRLWRRQKQYGSTLRGQNNKLVEITLNEQVLPWSSNEKYLGIQLDSNMTFTYQANCVASQAKKNMNAMKVISSFTHLSGHILKRVYSACVQSTLEYGAILTLLLVMCKSNIITLQRVQNQRMRLILVGYEPAGLTMHPPPQNDREWVHFFRIGV